MTDFQVNNYRPLIRTNSLSILKMRIHAVFNKLRHAMCLLSGFKGLKSKEIGGTENWRSELRIRNENFYSVEKLILFDITSIFLLSKRRI